MCKELAEPLAQNTVPDGHRAGDHFRLVEEVLVEHVVDSRGHLLVQWFIKAELAPVNLALLQPLVVVIIQILDVKPNIVEGGVSVLVVWGEETVVGLEAEALLFELGGGLVFE